MILIDTALTVLLVLVFARIVLSWFPPGGQFLESAQRFTFVATEWLLGPIRRILPPLRLGGAALDLSPMVVILGIYVIRAVIA
ncbi:MAG: YggT family protein [Microthrixaceae bacterium]